MKVAIGFHLQRGPWGGGNQFAHVLSDKLMKRGDSVRFDLSDSDIDIILLTDPRAHSPSVSFGAGAVLRYLTTRNPRALVIHRINECDERKGTKNMNQLLKRSNYCADHTVFIASWLKNLDLWGKHSSFSVILNGADKRIFDSSYHNRWNLKDPIKLVTHHWGGNRMKGFDIYEMLDTMLIETKWQGRVEFTYIGNLPSGFKFKNSRHIPPLNGDALARELASHHVYLTGSINEPAGMHHIEGAMCGLPLIYRRSGALPEYCDSFGIGFDGEDFPDALRRMIFSYDNLIARMSNYPHTAEKMCNEYIALFDSMVQKRERIMKERRVWRSPWLVLRNQVPF